jgi:hypothetical protein
MYTVYYYAEFITIHSVFRGFTVGMYHEVSQYYSVLVNAITTIFFQPHSPPSLATRPLCLPGAVHVSATAEAIIPLASVRSWIM